MIWVGQVAALKFPQRKAAVVGTLLALAGTPPQGL